MVLRAVAGLPLGKAGDDQRFIYEQGSNMVFFFP